MLWEKVQTYIVVTMVAVLIWLYAEAENVTSFPKTVQIEFFDPNSPDTIIDPPSITVDLIVRTANSGYAKLERELDEGPIRVQVSPDNNSRTTEQIFNIKAAIENSKVTDIVTIASIDQESITLNVEKIETILLQAKIDPGKVEVDGPIEFEPREFKVRVRSSRASVVNEESWDIQLDQLDLTGESPGDEVKRSVSIPIPQSLRSDNPALEPSAVNVTFRLRKALNTVKLPRVRVFLTSPPSLSSQFKVAVSEETPWLSDVELRGPAEAIARIQEASSSNTLSELVRAEIIILNAADVTEGTFEVTPTLWLPPGVTPVAQPKRVKYTVARVTAAPTTSPATNGTP